MRSSAELTRARRTLFEAYPFGPSADHAWRFQQLLADEIARAERDSRNDAAGLTKAHLRGVRLYGDALAFQFLSEYALRQLSRNPGRPPSLTSQGRAFDQVLNSAALLASAGIPPIVADLTTIVRVGDVLACVTPDLPTIIECKLSPLRHPSFERQGRRGRQRARMESIARLLTTGTAKIFGEDTERTTVTVSHVSTYNYSLVEHVVQRALAHKPIAAMPSEHEVMTAALDGETVDLEPVGRHFGPMHGQHAVVGSSLEPLLAGVWDVPPPINWEVSDTSRWVLMEGDVAISHMFRLEGLLGRESENVRVVGLVELSGHLAFGYQIDVGAAEPLVISGNVARDVVYRHETVDSVSAKILEMCRNGYAAFCNDAV